MRAWLWVAWMVAAAGAEDRILDQARRARDAQDRAALEKSAARAAAAADRQPQDPRRQYEAAVIHSYLAEIASETGDRSGAARAVRAGIPAAERAVALDPNSAEYHRLLGALCGQAVPADLSLALRYGGRARDELDRAIRLAPADSDAYLSRGVGKLYLPKPLGGGPEAALEDLRKAVELNPRSDQAHLWLGVALRRANRPAEARAALLQAVKLNPNRVWAKQQLDKTPAQ